MYTNTVRLPYTLWYDGKDKTFRMDMSAILPEEHYEDGKKYIGKIRNVQVSGYNVYGDIQPPPTGDGGYLDVSQFATAVYNEQKHYADITLKSFSTFNADGEIALYIDFEMYTGFEEYISDGSYRKKKVDIIIPIRSHENPSKDPGRFNNGIGIDRMDVRNGFAHTVGANEEPIVFSFDLITRDITDEFITNGQALDLVKNKSVESARLDANSSGLALSVNYKTMAEVSWEQLKEHLGSGSNSTEYIAPTLDEISNSWYNAEDTQKMNFANAIGSKMTLSVQENSTKDIVVYVVQDVIDLSGQPTKAYNLLFTIPRSFFGGESQPVDTESIKNSILSVIQQQIPNATTIKQEILADVTSRIPDKEALKNEVLAAVPTPSATPYELTSNKMTRALFESLDIDKLEFIDSIASNLTFNSNLRFEKTDEGYEVKYIFNYQNGEINHYPDSYIRLLTIPFSSLRELPTTTAGEPVTLEKILELVSDESKSEIISQLKSKLASTTLTAEQILDQATEAAADREKAGKLFQKLLDAETLNVVEKTDGYELSYTGDVNKVLVKIPKQAIIVSQEVITAALTENVVTETIKPTLDKSYYSKEEVDNLFKKLKEELTAEDHDTHSAEEHPQQ